MPKGLPAGHLKEGPLLEFEVLDLVLGYLGYPEFQGQQAKSLQFALYLAFLRVLVMKHYDGRRRCLSKYLTTNSTFRHRDV